MKILLYDDSVLDAHSKRILVEGIDTKRFMKNPVLIYSHESYQMPVGKVKSIERAGSKLFGEVEFDESNEFERILKHKYEKGYMNAFSVGVRKIEESADPEMLLPNQIYATITKSELWELSCVTLPSHEDALVIRSGEFAGEFITRVFTQKNANMLDELKKQFGLTANTEAEAIAELRKKIDAATAERADAAYKVAKRFGAFENEAEETAFRTLAKNDLDSALVFLKKAQEQPATEKEKRDATADTFASFAELLKRATAGAAGTEEKRNVKPTSAEAYAELKTKGA